jgi:hypothetical protein
MAWLLAFVSVIAAAEAAIIIGLATARSRPLESVVFGAGWDAFAEANRVKASSEGSVTPCWEAPK